MSAHETIRVQKKSILFTLLLAMALLAGAVMMVRDGSLLRPAPSGPQPPPANDFMLESADGPVSLHDFRGKAVLLHFPASLSRIARAQSLPSREERNEIQVLLVTVDPERDTPARLKEYAAYFYPNIIGLSGTPKTMARIARLYGADFKKHPVASSLGYTVDHTTLVYVIGKTVNYAQAWLTTLHRKTFCPPCAKLWHTNLKSLI